MDHPFGVGPVTCEVHFQIVPLHPGAVADHVVQRNPNGRLTTRNNNPPFAAKRELLEREAARLNTSFDALAIAAALAQPWADVVLSGAATTEQLRSNLTALKVAWDQEAAARLSTLREPSASYWAARSNMAWN